MGNPMRPTTLSSVWTWQLQNKQQQVYKRPGHESIELQKSIRAAKDPEGILQICLQSQDTIDLVNAVAALEQIAKAPEEDRENVKDDPALRALLDGIIDDLARPTTVRLPRNVAKILWAVAVLGIRDERLVDAVIFELEHRTAEFTTSELGSIAWAFAVLGARKSAAMEIIAKATARNIASFHPTELTNIVWAFAYLRNKGPALMYALPELLEPIGGGRLERRLSLFKAQDLAILFWALATLEVKSNALVSQLTQRLARQVDKLSPPHIAACAWASVTMKANEGSLMARLSPEMARLAELFSPYELAHVAWCVAMVTDSETIQAFADAEVVDALALAATKGAHNMDPEVLTMVLWAFAKLGRPLGGTEAAPVLTEEVKKQISHFNADQLVATIWALANSGMKYGVPCAATGGLRCERILEAVGHAGAQKVHDFHADELAEVAWSLAAMGYKQPRLCHSISLDAVRRAHAFSPKAWVNIAWSFATLNVKCSAPLLEVIGKGLTTGADALRPKDIANTFWAYVRFGAKDDELFSALMKEASKKVNHFGAHELSNTMWALACLQKGDAKLFTVLCNRAADLIKDFDGLQLADAAWACARMKVKIDRFCEVCSKKVEEVADNLNAAELTIVVCALVDIGHFDSGMLEKVSNAMYERMSEFTSHELCGLVRALTLSNTADPQVMNALIVEAKVRQSAEPSANRRPTERGMYLCELPAGVNSQSNHYPAIVRAPPPCTCVPPMPQPRPWPRPESTLQLHW